MDASKSTICRFYSNLKQGTILSMTVQFDEEKSGKRLDELHLKEEEDLAHLLSARYKIPYADLTSMSIDTDGLRLIPEADSRKAAMAVFQITGKKISIAVLSPQKDDTMNKVKELENRGYTPSLYITSTHSLEHAWERYKDLAFSSETKAGTLDISNEEINEFLKKTTHVGETKKLIEETLALKKGFKISRILEIILAGAFSIKCTTRHRKL
jgi:hypothetical protein